MQTSHPVSFDLIPIYMHRPYVELIKPLDDNSRVRLLEIPGVPGSDYINANYLDVSSGNSITVVYSHFDASIGIYKGEGVHCNTR